MPSKVCTVCGDEKPLTAFHKEARKGREGLHRAACKTCHTGQNQRWLQAHPGKSATYTKTHRSLVKGRATTLFNSARRRAKQRGLPCTITQEWVETKLKHLVCEATGAQLTLVSEGNRRSLPFSPSLDQIVAGLGYTPENTMLVCWAWNVLKHGFTEDEVRLWLKVLLLSPQVQRLIH
jgi:hypothetical protein